MIERVGPHGCPAFSCLISCLRRPRCQRSLARGLSCCHERGRPLGISIQLSLLPPGRRTDKSPRRIQAAGTVVELTITAAQLVLVIAMVNRLLEVSERVQCILVIEG